MNPEQLDHKLETTRPTLSDAEVTVLWHRIAKETAASAPVPSPYQAWFRMHYMAPVAVMLIALLGTTGTVAASQSARPGDLLFPVERAIERTQLFLASAEREAALRSHFANERLLELEDILAETGTLMTDDSFDVTAVASTTIRTFSAEADVFTDTTVVEVEINDVKQIFMTTATTREAVVGVVAARYGLAPELVAAALDFEIEDRASRPSERGRLLVDDASEARVSEAIGVLLDDLEGLNDTDLRDAILASLVKKIDRVEVRGREKERGRSEDHRRDDKSDSRDNRDDKKDDSSRLRIDDDRVEIREDGYRLRIDDDGDVRVTEDDDRDEDRFEDRDDNLDDDRSKRDDDDRYESRDDDEDEEDRDDDSRGHGRDDDEEEGSDSDDDRDDEEADEDNSGSGKDADEEDEEDN